ncbi:MAG TPA: hypothetical protein VFG04_30850 [Planctomycetaceae bacterium]|jgi:hypothetical protein|nr:hypothetical protein [Planctomycetaceae bacterium]
MLTSKQLETLDPAATVQHYRGIIILRDAHHTSGSARDELHLVAKRLRAQWSEWQGEDSLHEMAFGEPS